MLTIKRFFSREGVHPFDEIKWESNQTALIVDAKGEEIFRMEGIEAPANWSQLAVDIAASKYFRKRGVPETGHETSVKQLIYRVAHTIAEEGLRQEYFDQSNREIFEAEITWLLVNQHGAFNSPVWFNCGLYQEYGTTSAGDRDGKNWAWDQESQQPTQIDNNYERPQCSACFIQGVEDSLVAMTDLQAREVQIFKYGSGSGTNFSKIRAKGEPLSGGGESSGVISFLECFDRWAGSIKSGGTTRRAAKMVNMDIDHPEIIDFIQWKTNEEKKARILAENGYGRGDINSEAYRTVSGQNANNSIRVPDSFMRAYLNNEKWQTTFRTTGEICEEHNAKAIMQMIAEAAWETGDPALQFDDHINAMLTCPKDAQGNKQRIHASNPCGEYMFLDNSSCNLASINLTKYINANGNFDTERFQNACRIFFIAQEILVDFCSYPSYEICHNSHHYRPIGLGYTNLGALLMRSGIAYDSPEAREKTANITSILASSAYLTSAEIAQFKGPFPGFAINQIEMLKVINEHREHATEDTVQYWDKAIQLGEEYGYRNAQATLLAPTGTISLMMDCDTTGIEPDFALVKLKKYAGGGSVKIINQSAEIALRKLGYNQLEIKDIMVYMLGTSNLENSPHINRYSLKRLGMSEEQIARVENALPSAFGLRQVFGKGILEGFGFDPEQIQIAEQIICGAMTIEGAPHVKEGHLSVFDCANRCGPLGTRFIQPMAHVHMLARIEKLLSGSISKTINMPHDSTAEDIEKIYVESWKLGLKGACVYRDGSKKAQPLSGGRDDGQKVTKPHRKHMPDERKALAHKFSVAGYEGYLHAGFFDNGDLGEVFIRMAKQGSIIFGLMDTIGILISLALQYGVPLEALVQKFVGMRFDPQGITNNKKIPKAKSLMDYVFRWLGYKFLKEKAIKPESPDLLGDNDDEITEESVIKAAPTRNPEEEERVCFSCGFVGYGTGHCFVCPNCGADNGCFS